MTYRTHLLRRVLVGLAGAAAAVAALASPAAAQDPTSPDEPGVVDVLQVDGLFDDIVVDAIGDAIDKAVADDSLALILQVNSRGSVVADDELVALLDRIADAPVAIGIWVGPSGARLYGSPAQLLAVADVTGMANGARVGNVGADLSPNHPLPSGLRALRDDTAGLSRARDLDVFRQRISDEGIPVIKNMIEAFDGYTHVAPDGTEYTLDTTAEEVTESGTVQRTTIATTRFAKLGLVEQLFHTVASPEVAYLLLLTGLALLIFEFFTAGVGVIGVIGAASVFLACYGLAELPTRWWALGLLIAAMVAFAVDVQVGIPRFWTGVGILLTVVGSLWLFAPVQGTSLRPSWISLIAGVGGIMLAFVTGMPSMTRTRFSTPTVGREWMLGAEGVAVSAIDPDGVVRVGDAEWRARTNRATSIAEGEQLRVAAIDGVTLEVEPLEGAAKDYREMRRKGSSDDTAAVPADDPVGEPTA
ncbi:MAG TPA: NfeD family protein [Ilumatobacter sp.]|nr:NfeD family protein [Ilumatobacter sp.]